MQAIILAAGMGKRLGELTKGNTKCMVKVNGVTLVERVLHQLEYVSTPLNRIVIVTGYKGEKLREYIKTLNVTTPIVFVENPVYATTNNIYSLFLAKDYLLEDDTLLLESDLIFEDAVLERILQEQYPSLALVAKYESWMDGTVVTLDENDNIKRFIPGSKFRYEETEDYFKTVNIYKFSKEFSQTHYVPFLTAYSKALGNNEYYEQVLRVIALLDKPEIKALRLGREAWYEVDDVQDLDIAESIFCKSEEKIKRMEYRHGGYWRYPAIEDFGHPCNAYFPNERMLSELAASFSNLIRHTPSAVEICNLLASKSFYVTKAHIGICNDLHDVLLRIRCGIKGRMGVVGMRNNEGCEHLFAPDDVYYDEAHSSYGYTVNDLISFYENVDVHAIVLENPHFSTGFCLKSEDLLRFCEWCKTRDIVLVVDESFHDFADRSFGDTLLSNRILESNDNLIVIKNIGCTCGVPGLKLALYATANEDWIQHLHDLFRAVSINAVAEFYLQIYGKYEKAYYLSCEQVRSARRLMFAQLCEIKGLHPLLSQGCYILCRLDASASASEVATHIMNDYGFILKVVMINSGQGNAEHLCVAVKSEEKNEEMCRALAAVLES